VFSSSGFARAINAAAPGEGSGAAGIGLAPTLVDC
jgi:hypothetical protein